MASSLFDEHNILRMDYSFLSHIMMEVEMSLDLLVVL